LGAGAHGRAMLECWWLKEVAEKVLWRAPEGRGFSPALEFPHLRAPKGRPIPAQVNEAVKKSSISGLAHTLGVRFQGLLPASQTSQVCAGRIFHTFNGLGQKRPTITASPEGASHCQSHT